ncbi:MAG: AMP-binding protein [Clostridia bacterium]|nr:AMP-binding protein [Clostridia bacterium]
MKMDFLNAIPYVCERWQEVAEQAPDAPFLTEEVSDAGYTRRQVDELSARVFGWLSDRGIGTEDFVLIRLPRDARPFIAMLGVWKAGAAFTVVEDSYAPERVEAIREDCGCRLAIDEAAWAEILDTAPLPGFRRANEHDACFAIYTSGSTGRPKGVLQEYGKIKLNQASFERRPGELVDAATCTALGAPLNFIAAVKIFLNALYSGMRLIVLTTDTARNPVQLRAQFERYQVSMAFLSPSMLRVMSAGLPASLKTLVTGSESANGVWFGGVRLINNYGMSEAGFHVAQFEMDRRYDITPIGKPVLDDIRIRLLDEAGREVPDGEAGEICFDNPFFRGYVHLPEETARVLRGGVFHSGDMGRRLPDGNIVVTGRLSTMVKINGNRVEPGEIEAAMRNIPGIQNAAVRDFEGERHQAFLCAYYVADDDPGEAAIRAYLQRTLPHYMIPAFFTRMEAIPLNSNGKVDRFALPKPDVNAKARAYDAPRTPEEAAICGAFEAVLRVDRVGANDDFFELGGDSLSTALAAAELEALQVDYRDIYAWKTPREIAARLSDKGEADLDALSRAALERDQYLTPYQTYFYDAMLYSPTQDATSNPFTLRFPREAVEPERLKAALEAVFANYALFSTVCGHDADGVPVLRHVPGRIVRPEIRTADAHTVDMLMALVKPYRLDGELLYRCAIWATPTHVFLDMDTCHMITDGTCMANFMSELFAAYRGEPLRQDHYYWYLESQHSRRMALEHDADARLLMARFNREDHLCNPIPDLHSRRTGNGQCTSRTPCTLGELQRGCDALGTSLNKLFVAAALIALSRHGDRDKVTVEWTYNGRDENWKQDLVGMTIASVPVAVDMAEIRGPRDLLKEIDAQNALGMRYADLSLGNNGVTPGERDRMIVVYESGFDISAALPEGTEMSAAYDRLNGAFTRCQIILFNTGDRDAPMPFYINYDSELYSRALVERLCNCYNEAIMWMISGGEQ